MLIRATLLAGLMAIAAPLSAQQSYQPLVPPASGGSVVRATPAQNLDCAVWATYHLNTVSDEANKIGLVAALSWFTGLYEGATGKTINAPLRRRMSVFRAVDLAEIGPACSSRMQAYAKRLDSAGK